MFGGVLFCYLEFYYDYLDDFVKKLFEEIFICCDDLEICVQVSCVEGVFRLFVECFELVQICVDCNFVDGCVKCEFWDEIELYFIFILLEIVDFIIVSDNCVYEVDFECVWVIWEKEKEGLVDCVDFVRWMVVRIVKGCYYCEVVLG